jgi:outer membrane protein assembly factor BamB
MPFCHKQDQVEKYLMGELTEAQESVFEAHCRQCSTCADQVAGIGTTLLELDDPDDAQSLEVCFAAIQQEIRLAKSVAKKPASHWLRLAASLAVVFSLGAWLLAQRSSADDLNLTVNWQSDGNLVTSEFDQPVVRDGKVFTLREENGENHLLALSKADGSVIWKTAIGQTTRIVADEQRIFIGQFNGSLFSITALSVKDGSKEWTCDHAFAGRRPNRINFQLADGRLNWMAERTLYSFDTAHGELVWETQLSAQSESFAMPFYEDGRLLVAGSRNMYTLDHASGSIIRLQPHAERLNHYLTPQVAAAGDRIFVASVTGKGAGQVICYSKSSGRRLWIREAGRVKNIQSAEGLLFVKNDKLEAYDPQDGSLVWSAPIGGCYKLAFHNQNIFAIHNTDQSDIIALNSKTGRRIKSFEISGQSCSGMLIDGQDSFLTTNEGQLIAMKF